MRAGVSSGATAGGTISEAGMHAPGVQDAVGIEARLQAGLQRHDGRRERLENPACRPKRFGRADQGRMAAGLGRDLLDQRRACSVLFGVASQMSPPDQSRQWRTGRLAATAATARTAFVGATETRRRRRWLPRPAWRHPG